MQTVIVTGCAGFIGSHVTQLLLSKGMQVIGIDNFDSFYSKEIKVKNLRQFAENPRFVFYELDITKDLSAAITETSIDAVIHLAAKAGVRPSIQDPQGYIKTNIAGTQNIHELMLAKGIKKLVFASSSSVYGNNKKVPFSETDNVDNPISPYAFTKKAGELMNYTFHHLNQVNVVNLRFFTVYGPGQRPDLAINKFVKKVLHDEPLVLFGDGSTARDYTYIEDIAAGIAAALEYCFEHENVYETVNLGNNQPVKLSELVSTIYSILGKTPNLMYEAMQPGDVDITFADISKAGKLFNYTPKTSIEEGLDKYITWYKKENLK